MEMHCRDCAWCFDDCRETVYRREHCWFCRRKGIHFSRQYRVGEKTRIDPEWPACESFRQREKEDS